VRQGIRLGRGGVAAAVRQMPVPSGSGDVMLYIGETLFAFAFGVWRGGSTAEPPIDQKMKGTVEVSR
jgi:hypothetical protein